jgi:hypothetical protein
VSDTITNDHEREWQLLCILARTLAHISERLDDVAIPAQQQAENFQNAHALRQVCAFKPTEPHKPKLKGK